MCVVPELPRRPRRAGIGRGLRDRQQLRLSRQVPVRRAGADRRRLLHGRRHRRRTTGRRPTGPGKDGIDSKADFLADGAAQEQAIRAYMKLQWVYLGERNASPVRTIGGLKVTESGPARRRPSPRRRRGHRLPRGRRGGAAVGRLRHGDHRVHDAVRRLQDALHGRSFRPRGDRRRPEGRCPPRPRRRRHAPRASRGDDRLKGGNGADLLDGGRRRRPAQRAARAAMSSASPTRPIAATPT